MRRPILGSLALLLSLAASAWAQEAAPGTGQEVGNTLIWLSLVLPTISFIYLIFILCKRLKTNRADVARMLQVSEERVQLARQQLAAQEETNRLLRQWISGQDRGHPG